jgi:hypothetical protein
MNALSQSNDSMPLESVEALRLAVMKAEVASEISLIRSRDHAIFAMLVLLAGASGFLVYSLVNAELIPATLFVSPAAIRWLSILLAASSVLLGMSGVFELALNVRRHRDLLTSIRLHTRLFDSRNLASRLANFKAKQ